MPTSPSVPPSASSAATRRKTNGVPDEPPRETRTCARQDRQARGGGRRAPFVAASRSRCAPDGASCRISPCEVNIPQRVLLLDLVDSLSFPRAGWNAVAEVRQSEGTTDPAGPASKTRGPKAIFGRSNDARSVL